MISYTPTEIPVKNSKERSAELVELKTQVKAVTAALTDMTDLHPNFTLLQKELQVCQHRLHAFSDLWRTPNTPTYPVLKLVADALGGEITVDVTADQDCSTPASNHITEEDDFLSSKTTTTTTAGMVGGSGKVLAFMNCPYNHPHKFISKLCKEYEKGYVDRAVILCKQGAISNQKSGSLLNQWASMACHWGSGKVNPRTGEVVRRMPFVDVDSYLVLGTNFDVSLYMLGDPEDFYQAFIDYGSIWRPVR